MEAIDRTYHFKKTLEKKERFVGGHRLCAGCGAGIAVRGVLRALREEDRAVVGNATGCLEVSSFLYPYTAWEDSYIHSAFENASATCGGVEAAYKAMMKPTEGTILTVARVAYEEGRAAAEENKDPVFVWTAICQGATDALRTTPELLPVLKKAGVVDAGGKGPLGPPA